MVSLPRPAILAFWHYGVVGDEENDLQRTRAVGYAVSAPGCLTRPFTFRKWGPGCAAGRARRCLDPCLRGCESEPGRGRNRERIRRNRRRNGRTMEVIPERPACLTRQARRNNIVITMRAVHVSIRQIGNSQGVVIPKPVLGAVGSGREGGRGNDDRGWCTCVAQARESGAHRLGRGRQENRRGW